MNKKTLNVAPRLNRLVTLVVVAVFLSSLVIVFLAIFLMVVMVFLSSMLALVA